MLALDTDSVIIGEFHFHFSPGVLESLQMMGEKD